MNKIKTRSFVGAVQVIACMRIVSFLTPHIASKNDLSVMALGNPSINCSMSSLESFFDAMSAVKKQIKTVQTIAAQLRHINLEIYNIYVFLFIIKWQRYLFLRFQRFQT